LFAPDAVYRLTLATAGKTVTATTVGPATNYDTLIYMRRGCSGAEIACNDDDPYDGYGRSTITATNLAAGDYFIFVSGFGPNAGAYTLTVTVTP
jgi:hypothetical protein